MGFKMFKRLLHLLRCSPGKLLHDGLIEVQKGEREVYWLKGYRVFECQICLGPVAVEKQVDKSNTHMIIINP